MNKWFLFVLLAGYLPFFFVTLRPAIPQPALLVAVLAYLLMSCVSLSAPVRLRLPTIVRETYTLGIALFVFSDTIIALRVFAEYRDLSFLILPTYFASHVVLALALVLMGNFFDCKSKIP
jgi:prolipoprotein diacylglyceryltransferase